MNPYVTTIRTLIADNDLPAALQQLRELLAKNLKVLNSGPRKHYGLTALLVDLQDRHLLQLTHSREVTTDYQSRGAMRREKPEDLIAAMYDLGELPAAEVNLLAVFAVLPAERVPFAVLESSLPGTAELDSHLLALARKGWLDYNEEDADFKCSPVVQEVVRSKTPDLLETCRLLISTLIDKLDYEPGVGHFLQVSYDEALLLARYAEAVVNTFKTPDRGLAGLWERIGNYHQATGDLPQALFFFERCSRLSKELCDRHPQNEDYKNVLAISYSKIGETHAALGNLQQALTFFEKDIELSKELYDAYPQNVAFKNGLAISYSKLGETHAALGNLQQALTFFEQYNQLKKELYDTYPQNVAFKNGLAISYSKLGDTHAALGNLQQALTFFEDETQLFQELYDAYPQNVNFKNGLAVSYSKLGVLYRDKMGDKAKAKTYFQQCYTLWKELSMAYPAYVEFQQNFEWAKRAVGDNE